ncbi:MAG: hypothetical protein KDI27_02240 [Gammaproteobacteria bacterium]|nr:hypothetical protein [Gammaproteobacteria bacterium]MCB1850028.1 hypothetical protein [Gammaproteobacteria bacterium]
MDLFNLAFYAVVCGLLGLAAPWMGRISVRLLVGMLVGIVAAGALPTLKAVLGF